MPILEGNSRLGRLRMKAGISQSQLAKQLGVTTITVSRWERGAHQPTEEMRQRIAGVLGEPIDTVDRAFRVVRKNFLLTIAAA